MGAGASSQQRLGERALAASKKLAADKKVQAERTAPLKAASPETLDAVVSSIGFALVACSPFSEALLLVAFEANPEETQRMLQKACKKVLCAPINKAEYAWFTQYVFPSMVWMQRTKSGSFMFEEMMKIAASMADKIDLSMRSIFTHLQTHAEWSTLIDIQNETFVTRQDDEKVSLLHDQGIRDIVELKQQDELEALSAFIDSNLAVNMLTTTAKSINAEFQGRLKTVMSRFGDFWAGPVKAVERCQSKLENEYQSAAYPKAARLLDLVRCSVSFNTLEQLLTGYDGLMRYVETTPAPSNSHESRTAS